MSYYFFLGSTMLPVPPASMTLKVNGRNKTISLINEGEVNVIKEPGLSEISFDARLPNRSYPFADYNTSLLDSLTSSFFGSSFSFKKASFFMEKFKTAKQTQEPFRLIICRMASAFSMLFDTNMLVTLEEYSINEDAKRDGFDVVCPLKFKQYKPYGTKVCEVTTDENGNTTLKVKETRPSYGKDVPLAYSVRNEQSVWEAVQGVSGGALDWREILNLNGISNPCGNLEVGQVLHLV